MTKKINQYFTFDDSKKEFSLPTISKKQNILITV